VRKLGDRNFVATLELVFEAVIAEYKYFRKLNLS
jgi:hypothetical protein